MSAIARKRIHALREAKGITKAEMAERLNVSYTHYRDMENGLRKINTSMMVRIAHILGTTYHELKKG